MSESLQDIAIRMVATGKGILAADESTGSIQKRLESIGVASTPESRRDYREMLFRSDAMKDHISGVILFDETLRQKAVDGTPLRELIANAGSLIGIKVDTGAVPLPNFRVRQSPKVWTACPSELPNIMILVPVSPKWRGVIAISNGLPTWGAVRSNAHALARYAAICQEGGIVPIVEPEVLMDGVPGDHSIERCQEVTRWVLETLVHGTQGSAGRPDGHHPEAEHGDRRQACAQGRC
jgi:fructose-bisphosphate aldolase class I